MREVRCALPFLAFALALFVTGCSLLPITNVPTVPSPPLAAAVLDDLAAQHALWTAQAVTSYTWTVSYACECSLGGPTTITVVDGTVTSATNAGKPLDLSVFGGFPLTVDGLYDQATAALLHGGHVTGTWGGLGVSAKVNIDPEPQAIDDELFVTVIDLVPAK